MNAVGMINSNISSSTKGTNSAHQGKVEGFKEALLAVTDDAINVKGMAEKLSTNQQSNGGIEELLMMITQLFENVPLEEGYLSTEMLDTDAMNLLNQLPIELKNEIMSLFQSNAPLEGMFNKGQTQEASIIGSLIALSSLEKSRHVDIADFLKNVNGTKKINETITLNQVLDMYSKVLEKLLNVENLKNPKIYEEGNEFGTLLKNMASKLKEQNRMNGVSNQGDFPKVSLNNLSLSSSNLNNKNTLQQPTNIKVNLKSSAEQHSSNQVELETNVDAKIVTNKSMFVEQSPMNRLQQYVIHVNQGENKQVSQQQQLVDQFQQIMKSSKFSSNANQSELTIRLKPDHLGSLSVKLTQVNGDMMARIMVSSNSAKDLIESSIHQLKHVFTTQNIQVDKIDVVFQNNDQSFQDSLEEKEKEKDQQQSNQSKKDDTSEDKEEKQSFEEELLNLMV